MWGEKKKFDKEGRLIYYRKKYKDVQRWEYDEKGNTVYYFNSKSGYFRKKFDKNGNLVYYEHSINHYIFSTTETFEYDKYNRLIHTHTTFGDDNKWYKYGANGERIEISQKEFCDIEKLRLELEHKKEILLTEDGIEQRNDNRFDLMEI